MCRAVEPTHDQITLSTSTLECSKGFSHAAIDPFNCGFITRVSGIPRRRRSARSGRLPAAKPPGACRGPSHLRPSPQRRRPERPVVLGVALLLIATSAGSRPCQRRRRQHLPLRAEYDRERRPAQAGLVPVHVQLVLHRRRADERRRRSCCPSRSMSMFRVRTLRFLHVFASKPILGGTPACSIAQPYLFGDASIGPRQDEHDDLGDVTVGIMLGWHAPKMRQLSGIDFTLPTGAYFDVTALQCRPEQVRGDVLSTGSRATSPTTSTATCAPTSPWPARIPIPITSPGSTRALEYSLNYRLPRGWLIGLNGYLQQQLTDDEIDGVKVNGTGQRTRVFAYGPEVATVPRAGARARSGSTRPRPATGPRATSRLQMFVGL